MPAELGSSGASAANGRFQMLVGPKKEKPWDGAMVTVVPAAAVVAAAAVVPAAAVVVVPAGVAIRVEPTEAEGALDVGRAPPDGATGASAPPAAAPAGDGPGFAGALVRAPDVECLPCRALDRLPAER